MNFNPVKIVKTATSTAVAIGVGRIVSQFIENNTDEPEKAADKVVQKVGGFALGALVAERTAQYTDAAIDEIVAVFNNDIKPMFKKDNS